MPTSKFLTLAMTLNPLFCGTLVLLLIFDISASLRVRYSYPRAHGSSIGGQPHSYDSTWWEDLEAGAWDGYDSLTGFDGVGDDLGNQGESQYLDASFWVDSILEPIQDAPFTWNTPYEAQLQGNGYFVMLYGQLHVPSTGEYTFYSAGDDKGLTVWLNAKASGRFGYSSPLIGDHLPGITNNQESSTLPSPRDFDPTGRFTPFDVENIRSTTISLQEGVYRIRAWKWDSTGSGHCGLFWKKPGSNLIDPIPSTNFGSRKQPGPPLIIAYNSYIVGKEFDYPNVGSRVTISGCKTYHAEVMGRNFLSEPPKYRWDFKDGTIVETNSDTIEHVFSKNGYFEIAVRGVRSDFVGPPQFLWATVSNAEGCRKNQPPIWRTQVSDVAMVAEAGKIFRDTLFAVDPDSAIGDSVSYSISKPPLGLTISHDGIIQWTPSHSSLGTHHLRVVAKDGLGDSSILSYPIFVLSSNSTPKISSQKPDGDTIPTVHGDNFDLEVFWDRPNSSIVCHWQGSDIDTIMTEATKGSCRFPYTSRTSDTGTIVILAAVSDGFSCDTAVFTLSVNHPTTFKQLELKDSLVFALGMKTEVIDATGKRWVFEPNSLADTSMTLTTILVSPDSTFDTYEKATLLSIYPKTPSDSSFRLTFYPTASEPQRHLYTWDSTSGTWITTSSGEPHTPYTYLSNREPSRIMAASYGITTHRSSENHRSKRENSPTMTPALFQSKNRSIVDAIGRFILPNQSPK